jgi:ABC-type multidrug transport system fused ATPase/permease subunit
MAVPVRRRRYHWPELQLNIWIMIVFSASAICLGVFAWFMAVQTELKLGIPWYLPNPKLKKLYTDGIRGRLFPFMVVSGALGVFFIVLILFLAAKRFLLPGIIIVGSFILFVLWLTGLIETSLQLFGVVGNVDDNCQIYVYDNKFGGNNLQTMAWLTQKTICMCGALPYPPPPGCVWIVLTCAGDCWKTAFAFELVNTVFFLWMLVMSWQVHRDVYD